MKQSKQLKSQKDSTQGVRRRADDEQVCLITEAQQVWPVGGITAVGLAAWAGQDTETPHTATEEKKNRKKMRKTRKG